MQPKPGDVMQRFNGSRYTVLALDPDTQMARVADANTGRILPFSVSIRNWVVVDNIGTVLDLYRSELVAWYRTAQKDGEARKQRARRSNEAGCKMVYDHAGTLYTIAGS